MYTELGTGETSRCQETPLLTASHRSRATAKQHDSRRDASLDIAKGVAILLVVLGQSLSGLSAAGYFPTSFAWPFLSVYILDLFQIPLLFVIAGHLTSRSHRPAGAVVARLVSGILYPYLLWSVLYGLALVSLSQYAHTPTSIASIYQILWIPINPYGFLYALFFCHLGYLVIRRRSQPTQLVIAAIVFLAPQFFLPAIANAHLVIVLQTVRGFFYFVIGGISVSQIRQFGRWMAITATVLFILFAIIYYQSQLAGVIAAPAALPAGIAGVVATLAWSRMLAERTGRLAGTIAAALAFCGRYWMGIFVIHIFFTTAARLALQPLAFSSIMPAGIAAFVEIAVAVIAGVLGPLGINWIVSKFDLDKWFGLRPMETN